MQPQIQIYQRAAFWSEQKSEISIVTKEMFQGKNNSLLIWSTGSPGVCTAVLRAAAE